MVKKRAVSCVGAADFSLHSFPWHAFSSSFILDSSYSRIIRRGMDDVYDWRFALTHKETLRQFRFVFRSFHYAY